MGSIDKEPNKPINTVNPIEAIEPITEPSKEYKPTKYVKRYVMTDEHKAKLRANIAKARSYIKANKTNYTNNIHNLSLDNTNSLDVSNNYNDDCLDKLANVSNIHGLTITKDAIVADSQYISKVILKALKRVDWTNPEAGKKFKDTAGIFMILSNVGKNAENKPSNIGSIKVYQYYEVKPDEVKPILEAEEVQTTTI